MFQEKMIDEIKNTTSKINEKKDEVLSLFEKINNDNPPVLLDSEPIEIEGFSIITNSLFVLYQKEHEYYILFKEYKNTICYLDDKTKEITRFKKHKNTLTVDVGTFNSIEPEYFLSKGDISYLIEGREMVVGSVDVPQNIGQDMVFPITFSCSLNKDNILVDLMREKCFQYFTKDARCYFNKNHIEMRELSISSEQQVLTYVQEDDETVLNIEFELNNPLFKSATLTDKQNDEVLFVDYEKKPFDSLYDSISDKIKDAEEIKQLNFKI